MHARNSLLLAMLFLMLSSIAAQDDAGQKRRVFQQADSLFKAGLASYESKDLRTAIDVWNQALPLFRSLGERKAELMIVGNLAIAYRLARQADHYRQMLERQLELATELGDRKTQAASLTSIAHTLAAEYRYDEARRKFSEARLIYQSDRNLKEEAHVTARIATLYQLSSDYRESVAWFVAAQFLHESANQLDELAKDLIGVGTSYRALGFYDSALVNFNQALLLSEKIGDEELHALVLSNLGIVHDYLGQADLAERYHTESLALYTRKRNERGMADAQVNLGVLYHNRGDFQKAMEAYQNALNLQTKLNARQNMAKTMANIAVIHRDLNRLDDALDLLRKATEIEKSINDKQGLASHYSVIASIYWKKNDVARASDFLEQSIGIKREIGDRRGESNDLISFGWIQLREIEDGRIADPASRYPIILQTFEKAHKMKSELGDIYGEITALTYLGQTRRLMKSYEEAKLKYRAALQLAQSKRAETLIWQIRYGMARTLERQGLLNDAIAEIRSAVDLVENQRGTLKSEEFRLGYFQDKSFLYHDLVDWLVRNNQWEEAFNVTERSKSRSFLDLMGSRVLDSGHDEPLLAALDSLEKRMSALDESLKSTEVTADDQVRLFAEMDSLYQARKKLLKVIAHANEELSSLLTVSPLKASDIREFLDPDVTLVEYFVSQRFYLIFVVSKNGGVTGFRGETGLFQMYPSLLEFRTALTSPNSENYRRPSVALYDLLIKPVESALITNRLIFVPYGKLHYIPFGALQNAQSQFMVDRYTISYLPSSSMMKFIGAKRKSGPAYDGRLLAVGNPLTSMPELPAAEEEVKFIGDLYSQKTVLMRSDATETAIKSEVGKYNVVHFACHGVFNLDHPGQSGLFLTRHDREDGTLSMDEIFKLKLNQAQLVVLSACETGLSKVVQGDELIGLTRAFIYAGTPSLIASLWPVNDRSTTSLMKGFYEQLGAMRKPEALRQAQVKLKNTPGFEHPFYWSCFGIVGDWQ